MCGIAGIVYFDPQRKVDGTVIGPMIDVMSHRGPDDRGVFIQGNVGLGFRRLSIIDLSKAGHQPMSNEDGSLWLVFNGEIYNFDGLKRNLSKKGHRFSSRSDSEVILHLYEEYGVQLLAYLRGMFAFCLVDLKRRTFFAARDRLGKKPFYYMNNPDAFLFASEIKGILQHPSARREVSEESILDYMIYKFVPSPKTIFSGISKLKPGHYIFGQLDMPGFVQQREYWRLEAVGKPPQHTETEWLSRLEEKLNEAVYMRLVSDVPLGAFLSGGVDSSLVVSYMARNSPSPIHTFSIGFKPAQFDELPFARIVSRSLGTKHEEYVVEPDALGVIEKLVKQFDEPIADSSVVPTYYVSKIARELVKVALTGDGGDEIFGGYDRYVQALKFQRRAGFLPAVLRESIRLVGRFYPEGAKGKGFLRRLSSNAYYRFYSMISYADMADILSPDLRDQFYHRETFSIYERYRHEVADADYLTQMQYVELKTTLVEDILTKVDRASMLNSLEVRCPLLDHELVELAFQMPSTLRMRGYTGKHALKVLLRKYFPPQVVYRKKRGFEVPIDSWFRNDLRQFVRDVLLDGRTRQRGVFDLPYIEKMLRNHQMAMRNFGGKIWWALFLELWYREWVDR